MQYHIYNISNTWQALDIRAAALIVAGLLMLSAMLLVACDTTDPVEEEEELDCYPHPHPTFPDECLLYVWYHRTPAWHPDGSQIAYTRPDAEGHQADLYLYDLGTSEEYLVTSGASELSPQAWSPDGEWITFGYYGTIYKVRPDGSDRTRLTFERDRFRPAWSPDSEWIAYSDGTVSAPDQGTWIMRSDGSDNHWLPHVQGAHPTWHPDGDRILTIGQIPGFEYRIFINYLDPEIPSGTLDPYPSPLHSGKYYTLHTATYAPSGNHIVYDISSQDHRYNVWTMNINGSDIRRLTTTGGAMPAWAPDGQSIAYINIHWREQVIWLMDADGSNKRRMGPEAPPFCPYYVTDC